MAGTVTVNSATKAGKIGTGFAGFSFEKTHMGNGSFSGTNSALISLMSLLPGTVMRIGADDVDACNWVAAATPVRTSPTFTRSIGTADVDGLAAFVTASGAHVIYGVNFKSNDPATTSAEAAYAMSKLSAYIDGFEIGNEINRFGTWPATLKSQWESLQSAIATAAPGSKFIGPAGGGGNQTALSTPFAHDEASKLTLLTQHYYAGTAIQTGATATQIADFVTKLLVADPFSMTSGQGLIEMCNVMNAAAVSNNIPGGFRVGECNTFAGHGQDGVSNALISALWSLDYMFTSAQYGASGVNFHGGEIGMDGSKPFYYSPIEESNGAVTNVNPLFYGMLLFTLAGNGTALATTATSSLAHFTAYTIARTDGAMSVILVNKDTTSGVNATVSVGKAVNSASAIYLEGPSPASLTAETGITIAGSGITAAGAWARKAPYALTASGNTFAITVPPASAALVRVQ